jgi:hypothetical protein
MLIRIIAIHSPSTSLDYINKILEGKIATMNLSDSVATCKLARNKDKERLRETQMCSRLA